MKPFDLEAAKNGAPVVTASGLPARIICFDRVLNAYPIIALVMQGDTEVFVTTTLAGISASGSSYDLILASVKKTGWVNIYPNAEAFIYPTKEEADRGAASNRIACTLIEWEE